jgi:RNA polymerase sigma-54 factor
VDRQQGYLEHGAGSLQPLSRAAVADVLGLHESTVRRATANKYALLPNGEIIPYANFFTPSLSAKSAMKEVIDGEVRPLTDHDIQLLLQANGIHLAQRTITKYRTKMHIVSSTLR